MRSGIPPATHLVNFKASDLWEREIAGSLLLSLPFASLPARVWTSH